MLLLLVMEVVELEVECRSTVRVKEINKMVWDMDPPATCKDPEAIEEVG